MQNLFSRASGIWGSCELQRGSLKVKDMTAIKQQIARGKVVLCEQYSDTETLNVM